MVTPSLARLQSYRAAAVLVPLIEDARGPKLLFTERSSVLRSHAGQIAFPGGAVDAGESALQAALRESFEEIGLRVSAKDVLGYLSLQHSPAGFNVCPVVAVVSWPQPLQLASHEVADVFSTSLEALRQTVPEQRLRDAPWGPHTTIYYHVDNRVIWGLTGAIVAELLALLTPG